MKRKSRERGTESAFCRLASLAALLLTVVSSSLPQTNAIRLDKDGALGHSLPALSLVTAVRAGSEALREFSSKLTTGSLSRPSISEFVFEEATGVDARRREDWRKDRRLSSVAYPRAVRLFLEACPVFFAADRRQRICVQFFGVENEQEILLPQEEAGADARRAFASAPPCAMPALGLFFMDPQDAQVYIQHLRSLHGPGAADGLCLRAISLADAFPLLRYYNREARSVALAGGRDTSGHWKSSLWQCIQKVTRLLLSEGLDVWAGDREGSAVRCCLLPSLRSLQFALKQQRNDRLQGRFLGTPVFVLRPLRVPPNSELSRLLTQELQRNGEKPKPDDIAAKQTQCKEVPLSYSLELHPIQNGFWGFRVRYKGHYRLPVFCSEKDLMHAYQSLRDRLINSQCPSAARLPKNPPGKVVSVESIVDEISGINHAQNCEGGTPILLPSLDCLCLLDRTAN